MSTTNIPDNYPSGCSDDSIKEILLECQKEIIKYNKPTVHKGSTYYSQLAEQGNAELKRRLNEKLITNLEKSSKRQRELTWAIITIGGTNLIFAFLKLLNLIN